MRPNPRLPGAGYFSEISTRAGSVPGTRLGKNSHELAHQQDGTQRQSVAEGQKDGPCLGPPGKRSADAPKPRLERYVPARHASHRMQWAPTGRALHAWISLSGDGSNAGR